MFGIGKKEEKKEIINNPEPANTMFGRDFVKQSEASANVVTNKSESPKSQNQNPQPIPQPSRMSMPSASQTLPPTPTKPIENMVNNPQPIKQNIQNIPPKIDPVNNLTLPSLPKKLETQMIPQTTKPEIKTNNSSYTKPTQKINHRPFTSAKGPVFVSVKRYKELMTALHDLKYNASHLRQIIADLKQNRDTGTGQLSETADALSSLENNIEKVNSSIKA